MKTNDPAPSPYTHDATAESPGVVVTAADFKADPGAAYRLAAKTDVVVTDSRGAPRLIISRQRKALR